MNKKLYILLEDDNEILGNGFGHVMLKQYLPTKKYIEILTKHKVKATFYIDIAHYIFMLENESHSDYEFQMKVFIENIKLLVKNKMDIQLHIHSQWLNAKIDDENIKVTNKWNIGKLKPREQKKLLKKCFLTLEKILHDLGYKQKVRSFKAGSWGIQPINFLYDDFKNFGIKLILGPVKDLKLKLLDVDYSKMQINNHPYFVSKDDVNNVSDKEDIVVRL